MLPVECWSEPFSQGHTGPAARAGSCFSSALCHCPAISGLGVPHCQLSPEAWGQSPAQPGAGILNALKKPEEATESETAKRGGLDLVTCLEALAA